MSDNTAPAFTVVIPTYNRDRLLPRAIDSVLAQTLTDFELIVVDDGSTDATAAVVRSFSDGRVRYIHQPHRGRCAARNTGLAHAAGAYVTFLDSDDEAQPAWLETFATLLAPGDAGIACIGCEFFKVGKQQTMHTVLPEPLGPAYEDQQGLFLAGTFAVRRDLLVAVGGYAENLSYSENTELGLRLAPACLASGWRMASAAEPLVHVFSVRPSVLSHEATQSLMQSARYILSQHDERLRRAPREYATYCRVAGVNAARLGIYREARQHFARAILADPWRWKQYLYLGLAYFPAVSGIFWARNRDSG